MVYDCSVVVPAFNVEREIGEALDSLIGQETSLAFEIIAVDDGSTDGTEPLIRSYHDRVTLMRKANGGPASARNLGVRSAQSDIILFLDADDRALPERIERQARFMLENPDVAVCFGNFAVEGDTTDYLAGYGLCGSPEEIIRLENPFAHLMIRGDFVPTSASAVRKTAYIAAGLQPEAMMYAEDYALWCNIASTGGHFAFTSRCFAWYRRSRAGRLTTSAYTYYGPVAVMRDNLSRHAHLLTREEYNQARTRLCKLSEVLLRHQWAAAGHRGVLDVIDEFDNFLPEPIAHKWRILSLIPRVVPGLARSLLRRVRLALKSVQM